MTTTATPAYQNAVALTHGLNSLASDTNLVAGRESNAADNTSDLAIDAMVGGKVKLGTSPTGGQVEVWAAGSYDGTSYSGGATGADANLTPQAKSLLKLLGIVAAPATTGQVLTWGPYSVASAFGGAMPRKWSVFIVHNTGVALDATAGSFETKYTPIKYQSA